MSDKRDTARAHSFVASRLVILVFFAVAAGSLSFFIVFSGISLQDFHSQGDGDARGQQTISNATLDALDAGAAETPTETKNIDAAEIDDIKASQTHELQVAENHTAGEDAAAFISPPTEETEKANSEPLRAYGPPSRMDGEFNCGECKVHVCGYVKEYGKVAGALFPERQLENYVPLSTVVGPNDIAVVSGKCRIGRYPGAAVLYIDGEQGKIFCGKHPRMYYLGVEEPPYIPPERYSMFLGHIPWYDVANMPVIFGYSANDFLTKNYAKQSSRAFLAYVQTRCEPHRDAAFNRLVAMAMEEKWPLPKAGNCTGNYPQTQDYRLMDRLGLHSAGIFKNHAVFSSWKFVLCMENTDLKGYVTEKIANAFRSGAIPIYWGTKEIFKIFNKNAFIYYDITDPVPALEKVRHLMKNLEAYQRMLDQPTLAHGVKTLEDYFSITDDVGGGKLKKRIRMMLFNQSSELRIRNFDNWKPPPPITSH